MPGAIAIPALTALRSAGMPIEQRGTITRGFLFADLRGYTNYVEQRGAVAAAELLRRYRVLARQEIGRFGGAEIKTEGDSFYVVFDSVSSAVRCGLAITAAAQAGEDEPIAVGIGIHAGETIEADGALTHLSSQARNVRRTAMRQPFLNVAVNLEVVVTTIVCSAGCPSDHETN